MNKRIVSDTPASHPDADPESRGSADARIARQNDRRPGTSLAGHVLFYERVSTPDQHIERQSMAAEGVADRVFTDHGISGTKPALEREGMRALLEFARPGDTLRCVSIDRIGRSTRDVLSLVALLRERNIGLHVDNLGRVEGPLGELLVAILASIGQLERDQLSQKTREGLRAAVERRGVTLGRPAALTVSQRALVVRLAGDGLASGEITAMIGGVSQRSVQRVLAEAKKAY